MSKSYKLLGGFFALVIVGVLGYAGFSYATETNTGQEAAASQNVIHVRWVLAHQPTDVFANATKVFAATLSKESGGQMVLDVLTPAQVGFTGTGDIPYSQAVSLLNQKKAEISSVYTVAAATTNTSLGVVNLPYLFTDYTSASKVFDSATGSQLLAAYASASTVHALAFTYSGGYRLIASNKKNITSLNDLKGLRIATSGGPVAEAFLKAVGAIPVSLDLESGSTALTNIDAVETTYSRLSEVVGKNSAYTKYITESNHSLFTTMVVVDNGFFSSLSSANQAALQKAATAASQVERQDSIALGVSTKAALVAGGSVITAPAASLTAQLKEKAQGVYTSFASGFGSTTISAIKAAQ